MKVILTADVDKLGKSGEMKEVAEGYARNFLIARKVAVPAAGGAFRAWQHDIASREDKRQREREDADWVWLRFSVSDSGAGISPAQQQRLFQAYLPASGTVGGSGLGLSITRTLSELLGGRVARPSAVGA